MDSIQNLYGLVFASFLPVFFSVFFYVLETNTKFANIKSIYKQIIIGIVFGGLSILGSELGYSYLGVILNCRDAAPVCAGLLFGPWAGVIAGLMGGIERWCAVAWGAGTFTRLACSLGTLFAGLNAAFLRKFILDDRRPFWLLAISIAVISEVVHLILVMVTNMNEVSKAFDIIYNCAVILIVLNSFSVGLSSIFISLISKTKLGIERKKRRKRITQIIQKWLMIAFLIAFVASSWFMYTYQTSLATQQSKNLISISIEDVEASIDDLLNKQLLETAYDVLDELDEDDLNKVAMEHGIAEIDCIDSKGIIYRSTNEDFIGFDMASGEQSREFLVLLNGEKEYAQKYGPVSYYQNRNEKDVYRKYVGIAYKDGFIQVAYNATNFQKQIENSLLDVANNRHIGENGFLLIVNVYGEIVFGPDDIKNAHINTQEFTTFEPMTLQECTINGEQYFYSFDKTEGFLIVGLYPHSEAMRVRDISIYINGFVELIIFGALYIMIYNAVNVLVVKKVTEFQRDLNKISNGDLNTTLNIRTTREYSELSDDINKTVDTLKKYISDAEQRMKTELDLAKNIQKSSLPIVTPIISKRGDFEIAPFMDTAKEVGGDFYDFYFTDRHTLNFAIADVSGKGIPAALFMMRAKTELRSLSENGYPVNEVLERGNAALCNGNDAGMFVTCWQGRIDLETGVIQYANGGHNPPIVKRKNGDTFYLKGKVNFILAGMENSKYVLQELKLEPGDIIFLYTDGVTEATNSEKKLYGEERLLSYIQSHDIDKMSDLCIDIKKDIDSFVLDAPQFDDISMVAFKYNGNVESNKSTNLLKIGNIKMNVDCADWEDGVKQVTDLLIRAGSVHESYVDELIRVVKEEGPYIVLLPGFALAHTERVVDSVYKNDVSLITLNKGINFGSPNDPVRVIMAISCTDYDSHVSTLQAIASNMIEDGVVDQILACKDETEIVKIFKN